MKHIKIRLGFLLLSVLGISNVQAQTVKDSDGNVYQTITLVHKHG